MRYANMGAKSRIFRIPPSKPITAKGKYVFFPLGCNQIMEVAALEAGDGEWLAGNIHG
jgi:hypothetical protein